MRASQITPVEIQQVPPFFSPLALSLSLSLFFAAYLQIQPAINNKISCALFVRRGQRFPDSSGETLLVDESQVWETSCGEWSPGARVISGARR